MDCIEVAGTDRLGPSSAGQGKDLVWGNLESTYLGISVLATVPVRSAAAVQMLGQDDDCAVELRAGPEVAQWPTPSWTPNMTDTGPAIALSPVLQSHHRNMSQCNLTGASPL